MGDAPEQGHRKRCAHCTSKYGIEEFVARVREDEAFASALDEAMASGETRRVGEFLCENSYSASAREFAEAMAPELDNPQLPHLGIILSKWGLAKRGPGPLVRIRRR